MKTTSITKIVMLIALLYSMGYAALRITGIFQLNTWYGMAQVLPYYNSGGLGGTVVFDWKLTATGYTFLAYYPFAWCEGKVVSYFI